MLKYYRNSIKSVGNKQCFVTIKKVVARKRYFRAKNREWKKETLLLDSLSEYNKKNPQPEEGGPRSLADRIRDLPPIPPEFIRTTIYRETPRFSLRAPRTSSRARRSSVRSGAKTGGDDNGGGDSSGESNSDLDPAAARRAAVARIRELTGEKFSILEKRYWKMQLSERGAAL